jgi:hypothetical protein
MCVSACVCVCVCKESGEKDGCTTMVNDSIFKKSFTCTLLQQMVIIIR